MNADSFSTKDALKAVAGSGIKQEKALEWLYRYQVPTFKRFFIYRGLSNQQADDIVQIVVIKIFTHAKEFRGGDDFSDASAKSWMWKIVRTSLIDFIRKEKRGNRIVSDENPIPDFFDEGDNVDQEEINFPKNSHQDIRSEANQETAFIKRQVKVEKFNDRIEGDFELIEVKKLENSKAQFQNSHVTDAIISFTQTEASEHEETVQNSSALKKIKATTHHNFDLKTATQIEAEIEDRAKQIKIDECVSKGIEEFSSREPERAEVLLMQIDGLPIKNIANHMKRTEAATKEYLSQCRKKLKPFLSVCFEILT